MKLKEINFGDIELVYVDKVTNTPYCKNHGAMNKLNKLEDEGGYWRCISAVSSTNDTLCRAGCVQLINN